MRYLLIACLLVVGCQAGPVGTTPVSVVETVSGVADYRGQDAIELASADEITIVQVWCSHEGGWYAADIRISDGMAEFQCNPYAEWRAKILH